MDSKKVRTFSPKNSIHFIQTAENKKTDDKELRVCYHRKKKKQTHNK